MNAFITGSAGFVGGHLSEHLRAAGDAVLGASLHGDDQTVAWDIGAPADAALIARLEAFAPSVIYHLAAVSKATDCDEDEAAAERSNVRGTEHVLELAAALPSRPRVVFVSSSYVYEDRPGDAHRPPVRETESASNVSSGYARSKIAGEKLVRQFVAAGGDAVIARAFQHAGPAQSPRFMLAEWCEQFARRDGKPVVIYKNNAIIDLSDVRDVVRAYRLLAERGMRGETYNVGAGIARRTGDIFEQLRQLADPARPYQVKNEATSYGPIADISKIRAAIGWQPQIPLEQTIADTYAWFVAREAKS